MQQKSSKPASKLKERVVWAFACLGFMALLALPVYFQIRHNHEALGWPTTTGLVVSSEVSESYNAEADDTSYYFDATYAYQVGARRLSGHSSLGPFSWVADAREWVQSYPPGSEVTVYYSPSAPDRSVVWPEANIDLRVIELEFPLVLVLFLCCVAFVCWLWEQARAKLR
jgi:hypothetical protein